MPRAKETKKQARARRQLITPASRARITRIVCEGTCRCCRQFQRDCECADFEHEHRYEGSRRGIKILIELRDQPTPAGLRIHYRVRFPGRPGERLVGIEGTVFDVIQRIQRKYDQLEYRW